VYYEDMKKVVLVVLGFFFILPCFASADVNVSGSISPGTIWSPANGIYIIENSFFVPVGVTLTIKPGTIVKVKNLGFNFPVIYGKIAAIGTEDAPIIFTAFDSNNKWQGLYFKPGSEGVFDYVDLSYSGYGGYGFGDYVGIENDGGTLNIKHSNIHDNYSIISNGTGGMSMGSGIWNKGGTLSLSDSIVDNNMWGIRIESGAATISGNVIKNNVDSTGYGNGYGIYAYGPDPLILVNNTFEGNKRTANISASKNFTHSGNTSSDQTNRGFEISETISNDTIFNSDDLPFIINNLNIPVGKTLTIEPGTIIKMNDHYFTGSISVNGNLIAKGTKDKKIYITSLRDDTVGGDTNGDGSATIPGPKNWSSIFLEAGSKTEFDNVEVSYGGWNYNGEYMRIAAAIYQHGAEFSASNSVFEHNATADIFQDAGTTTISNSKIINGNYGIWFSDGNMVISQSTLAGNTGLAIYNENGPQIDVRNNWWGDASGPKDISTITPTGIGDKIYGNILYVPFLTEPPSEKPKLNPVIIVPGIVGTELYDGSDQIWMNIDRMFIDVGDQFLNILNLDNQGNSNNNISVGKIIENKTFLGKESDIFKSLIQDIETDGYQENTNLFFFPYDWRLDLSNTKDLLKQKIDEIKTQTGAQKVDIVAHSMGGLLVKDYMNSYGKGSVDKLIFVGTPHLGAPKAGKTLVAGDSFSIPWLNGDRIKEIAANSPALHELIPNQTYFNEFQGYFKKFGLLGSSPLLNYDETKNFFLNERGGNSIMFQKAENFYNQNLDNFDFSGVDTYNIAGCKTATQAAYSFGIFGEIGHTGYTSGDGTVPMVSADYINIPNQDKFYVKDGSHSKLPSTNGVRDLILGILKDDVNNLAGNVSNDSSFCSFKGKKLTWHSPVEIHVYDSQGNHTGPIENDAIEYGIPGVDYDVMGHNKFVFLPTDGGQEYLVEAKGLETGSFDLSISEIDNGQYLATQIFNDVPVTTVSIADLTINNLETNSLELKNNGVIEQVLADATLSGEVSLDLVPPETTIKAELLKGKKQNKDWQVTLTATDDESGILETAYSLDEGDTFNIYSKPFIADKKTDKILYYSVDKAGNNEDVKEFNLEKNKPEKCKSWKCLDINKKHNKIKKMYERIKGDRQGLIKWFNNLKLRHK
jgi:hypothetical protein